MENTLRLLTGPRGPDLLARMVDEFPPSAKGIWIVPTELAQSRLISRLSKRDHGLRAAIWTWPDLWREVRERRGEGPIVLGRSAALAILDEAIRRAKVDGRLDGYGDVVDSAGFRKRMAAQVAAWTRSARDLGPETTSIVDPDGAAWEIFRTYRGLLRQIRAEDDDGLARWASGMLLSSPPEGLHRFSNVYIVEPPGGRDVMIALDAFRRNAARMVVSAVRDVARPELFASQDQLASRLVSWGFTEEAVPPGNVRPDALCLCSESLFEPESSSAIAGTVGVTLLGAPEGLGEGLLVARRAMDLIAAGAEPSDIVVVTCGTGLDLETLASTMRQCGLEAGSVARRGLDHDPAIAALRLAMELPINGWDAEGIIRLLRHGQFRPNWPEAADPNASVGAATAIRESRAYRGLTAIPDALRRAAMRVPDLTDETAAKLRNKRSDRASKSLPLVERLLSALAAASQPGSWAALTDRLFSLADDLGVGSAPAIDRLRLAVEEHGALLGRFQADRRERTWRTFVAKVRTLIRDLDSDAPIRIEAPIRVVIADDLAGVEALHVIVVGLAEGAFAAKVAMGSGLEGRTAAWWREASRFLRIVDCASESLTLVFPTVDAKGNRVLACGMLDEFRRLFTDEARDRATHSLSRLDGVLPERLAMSPAERAIFAVWGACDHGDLGPLRAASSSPSTRAALNGAARALRLAHWRARSGRFHRFEGRLTDPRIVQRLEREHGPRVKTYSPSQLESLAYCPFQFFQRYILGLEPIDDRREFDDDYAARGSLLHLGLEVLHSQIRDVPADGPIPLADRVEQEVRGVFDRLIASRKEPTSEVEQGLMEIEGERLRRIARRYARQFRDYDAKPGRGAACDRVEVEFGDNDAEISPLVIDSPEGPIRIRGKIDRIDLVHAGDSVSFRVIDYKSGSVPGLGDLKAGLALQLPLYILAAERVLFPSATPLDAAYWGLKEKGFSPSKSITGGGGFEDWAAFAAAMERYVIQLITRLKRGDFPVRPRVPNCDSHCDYRQVCRVKQARRAEKIWLDAPRLEAP